MNRRLAVSPPVFFTSAGLLIAMLGFAILKTKQASVVFAELLDGVSTNFGWLYTGSVAVFIAFSIWLLLSPYAALRLGKDDERPEFGTLSWFSMLFSAGMGIGLVFYGVAEPIMHYQAPPTGEGMTTPALRTALPITFFHWGIHAWSVYVLMGLGIAYFAYRKDLPLAIRSCFYPILGERIHGWAGHAIDVVAVFGTLFGLAASLGLGAMQVSAGLNRLFSVPHTLNTQLILIAVITFAATLSLVTGVKKGIRRLSELNMTLAALLMVFVFAVGPTREILDMLVENVGGYIGIMVDRTFRVGAINPAEKDWAKSWTVFYWGWWIAWCPFVGMFVARISRGRTIREFVLGVLLVPTAVTILWFSVFGGTALQLELAGKGIAEAVSNDVATAIYVTLDQLPIPAVTSMLAASVVAVFFVTSSDSASFVVDMLTSGGHPNPPVWQRVFWATAEGACAAVLLYAGGKKALDALQAAVVSIGLPFCFLLLGLVYGLVKTLRTEIVPTPRGAPAREPDRPKEARTPRADGAKPEAAE